MRCLGVSTSEQKLRMNMEAVDFVARLAHEVNDPQALIMAVFSDDYAYDADPHLAFNVRCYLRNYNKNIVWFAHRILEDVGYDWARRAYLIELMQIA